MKFDHTTLIINAGVFIFVIFFVIIGTDDFAKLSSIFEKVATLNITISIGYGALLAAIAALASHNTSQDPKIKTNIVSSVYITVFYVLLNIITLLISFLLEDSSSPLAARILIGVLITILVLYSNFLLKISKKLIY